MANVIIDKKTGEIKVSPYSKYMKKSVGLELGTMIFQNMDFAWSDEIRDFVVVEGDKEDRQAYIDSFADDCGVYNVLKKYSLTGDASLLNQHEGFYGDISDIPTDELNPDKLVNDASSSIDKLNQLLGTSYTAEEFASLTSEQLETLISSVVSSNTPSDKKDGE